MLRTLLAHHAHVVVACAQACKQAGAGPHPGCCVSPPPSPPPHTTNTCRHDAPPGLAWQDALDELDGFLDGITAGTQELLPAYLAGDKGTVADVLRR